MAGKMDGNKVLTKQKQRHLIGMDLVRIFSCLCILCVHESYIPKTNDIAELFGYGSAGVQFFFVISGYLAASTFTESPERSTKQYYKNRIIRIVPSYYLALIFIIIWNMINHITFPKDVLHLGWGRYFLFLNTVLPSANYDIWNNINALWTISNFVFFYLFVPLLIKEMDFIRSTVLVIISFAIRIVFKFFGESLLFSINWIDKPNVLIGCSPISTFYQFALGVMVFYMIKERKRIGGLSILVLLLAGVVLKKNIFINCGIGMCLVILGCNKSINLVLDKIFRRITIIDKSVKCLSRDSFRVYLFHMLGYEISQKMVSGLENKYMKYSLYVVVFCVFILFACVTCGATEKCLKKLI